MTGQSCCPSTTYLVALPPVRNAAASLFEFARIAVGCATDTECRHALSPNVSVIACTAHNQQSGEISRRVPEGFCSDRRTKPIRLSRPHLLDGAVSVAFLTVLSNSVAFMLHCLSDLMHSELVHLSVIKDLPKAKAISIANAGMSCSKSAKSVLLLRASRRSTQTVQITPRSATVQLGSLE